MTTRLDQRIAQTARQRPDAVALEWVAAENPQRPRLATATYAQLDQLASRVADRLRRHYAPGSVILLRWPNGLACVVGFLACIRAGLKVFPISLHLAAEELRTAARRSAAVAMIGYPEHRSMLEGLTLDLLDATELMSGSANMPRPVVKPPPADPEPGLLLLSSGTTGTSKIVFRDCPSLDAVAENVANAASLTARDRVLGVVQLSHSFGIENAMLAPLWAGSTVHLLRAPDARDLPDLLAGRKITVLPAVPFLFELLVQAGPAPTGVPHLRLAYSAGAPLPAPLASEFLHKFGRRIGQLYGATEIGSVTFHAPDDPAFDPASAGLPMPGVHILILSADAPDIAKPLRPGAEGHVAVRATSMFRHYIDGPTDEVVAGHLLTGDLGKLDPAGRLTLTGRLKLLIDVGGMKVNPQEVEQVLLLHPAVRECVVVPLPVSQTVERLKAVVVPRRTDAPFPTEELRAFAGTKLSAYKVPRVVEVVKSLPRSPAGKILRHKLVSE